MSSTLYVALASGHDHTVSNLDDDAAAELRRRIVAHLEATEQHPVIDLGDGTVVRTESVVLTRTTNDGPRTGFVN